MMSLCLKMSKSVFTYTHDLKVYVSIFFMKIKSFVYYFKKTNGRKTIFSYHVSITVLDNFVIYYDISHLHENIKLSKYNIIHLVL